jgi:hypothetical protein
MIRRGNSDWTMPPTFSRGNDLQVDRIEFSYLLHVAVTWEDPFKAQRFAAAVTERYLATQREARQEALQRVAAWLKEQIQDLQSRVLEIEGSIEKPENQSRAERHGGASKHHGSTDAGTQHKVDGAHGLTSPWLVFRSNQMIHSLRVKPRQAALSSQSVVNHLFHPEHYHVRLCK